MLEKLSFSHLFILILLAYKSLDFLVCCIVHALASLESEVGISRLELVDRVVDRTAARCGKWDDGLALEVL